MTKIRVEFCIISARGLRSSSIWKLQWFAVGWINPNNKYCTRINGSGGSNPIWRTKFSVVVDEDDQREMELTVEVRSRESIFLREKLHGTVSIPLWEFFDKFGGGDRRSGMEEMGSFQLRGRNSGEPRGFIDVSVRICENLVGDESGDFNSTSLPSTKRNRTALSTEDDVPVITIPDTPWQQPQPETRRPFIHRRVRTTGPPAPDPRAQPPTEPYAWSNSPPTHPTMPFAQSQSHSEPENFNRRPTPPPPPPPSNTGFIPSFFPTTYPSVPNTSAGRYGGFGMGVGAGALAAGALLFGDDFISGTGFPTGGGLDMSFDPPF